MHNLKSETSDFYVLALKNTYSSDNRAVIFYEYSWPELLHEVTFSLF